MHRPARLLTFATGRLWPEQRPSFSPCSILDQGSREERSLSEKWGKKSSVRETPPVERAGAVVQSQQSRNGPAHVIDWTPYETAYGSAAGIPILLDRLGGSDQADAMIASHDLWCSLCHQHAFVSTAALPALPFILATLDQADEALKIEILDIVTGFATCTVSVGENEAWMNALREELQAQLPRFRALSKSENELIAHFSNRIVGDLQ